MKTISISRAKKLENSISLFTGDMKLEDDDFELQDDDGNKHENNDEFVLAVKQLKEARNTIKRILS